MSKFFIFVMGVSYYYTKLMYIFEYQISPFGRNDFSFFGGAEDLAAKPPPSPHPASDPSFRLKRSGRRNLFLADFTFANICISITWAIFIDFSVAIRFCNMLIYRHVILVLVATKTHFFSCNVFITNYLTRKTGGKTR